MGNDPGPGRATVRDPTRRLPRMPDLVPRLTSLSSAAGCAAKLGMDELDDVLATAFGPIGDRASGDDTLGIGDDAAIVRVGDQSVVATTDFFTPIVDDPHTWGWIAATNAIGDVHAMGGVPTAALMVLGWPSGERRGDLDEVLTGVRAGAAADGVTVVGGHSISSAVPFVGLAVLGSVEPPVLRQDVARPGDALVLTAPVGTGIATTAALRAPRGDSEVGGPLHEVLAAAVAVMTTSNRALVPVARGNGVVAATDVTGFGLLGHLHRVARSSGVDVTVEASAVPVLPGVVDLARRDVAPGGSRRNVDAVVARAHVDTDPVTAVVLADAQTSGGLLLACPPAASEAVVAQARAVGHRAARVGTVTGAGRGRIDVTGRVG